MNHVLIVGLGRVGLTLAVTLARKGVVVTGVEKDKEVVARLKGGEPHFFEEGLSKALRDHIDGNLHVEATVTDREYDAYVICVGTPLDLGSSKATLSYLESATQEVAGVLRPGKLVVVRSTVPVGTTRNVVMPILRANQKDFDLAACPERTSEGRALEELPQLAQIVGGLNGQSVNSAVQLFSQVTPTVVRLGSLEAAEAIKLIDNSWRDLIFAFANEIGLIAEALGLVGTELVHAANLGYPRNDIPVPGFVGGPCLAKDPYILIEAAAKAGFTPKLIRTARETNEQLPGRAARRLHSHLERLGKRPSEAKVLLAGVAFKGEPETDDIRDSPSLEMARVLREELGYRRLYAHDYVVPDELIKRAGLCPTSLEDGVQDADALVFMTNSRKYKSIRFREVAERMNRPAVVFDGWQILDRAEAENVDGIVYERLGG